MTEISAGKDCTLAVGKLEIEVLVNGMVLRLASGRGGELVAHWSSAARRHDLHFRADGYSGSPETLRFDIQARDKASKVK